jgi:hypothetical protein
LIIQQQAAPSVKKNAKFQKVSDDADNAKLPPATNIAPIKI